MYFEGYTLLLWLIQVPLKFANMHTVHPPFFGLRKGFILHITEFLFSSLVYIFTNLAKVMSMWSYDINWQVAIWHLSFCRPPDNVPSLTLPSKFCDWL